MIIGFLFPLVFLVIVIIAFRKLLNREKSDGLNITSVRRAFQYLLLFGLLVISGNGLTGLLGRLFNSGNIIVESRSDLARDLTFVLIGLPLFLLVANWTSRNFKGDEREKKSFGWNLYLSLAQLTSLILIMTSSYSLLLWAIREQPFNGRDFTQLIFWGMTLLIHRQIAEIDNNLEEARSHLILSSLIGLGVTVVGVTNLISNTIRVFLNQNIENLIVFDSNTTLRAALLVTVGLPVWYIYWVRTALNLRRELLWYSYVMLIGIMGGFIALVVSLNIIVYQVLVWFFGNPSSNIFIQHFNSSAGAVGSGLVGCVVWWYHARLVAHENLNNENEEVLNEVSIDHSQKTEAREIERIYEYIISGISLITSGAGFMMISVAIIESVIPSQVFSTTSSKNTLLLAFSLILVSAPIWWFFWRRIELRITLSIHEKSSATRRIYLSLFFGVSLVASVISLISAVFLLLDDLLNAQFSGETIRQMRFAISILLANGVISLYHWSIYRVEHKEVIHKVSDHKDVILIGLNNLELEKEIKNRFKGRVQNWSYSKVDTSELEVNSLIKKVLKIIDQTESREVMIIRDENQLKAVPINRH